MSAAPTAGQAGVRAEPPSSISAADAALAERERALPGLAALLDEGVFTALLDDAYPQAGVRVARARYLRLKPSTNCLVAYEVETSGRATRVYARTHPRFDRHKLARVNEARAVGPLGRGGRCSMSSSWPSIPSRTTAGCPCWRGCSRMRRAPDCSRPPSEATRPSPRPHSKSSGTSPSAG